MRGTDLQQSSMFSYISTEQRVPKDHPLRALRVMADAAAGCTESVCDENRVHQFLLPGRRGSRIANVRPPYRPFRAPPIVFSESSHLPSRSWAHGALLESRIFC